ncbi:MAG: amidohydrolase [Oscillospiraceae bacterium]|nr:amidohydrolase [Oscillospiraceae bacterium]
MIRIINGAYLDTGDMSLKYGDIAVDGDRITAVGDIPDGEYERTVNAAGNLIIPGFNNAHAHSPMTFLRGLAEDLPLDRWLNEVIFPAEAKLSQEGAELYTKISVLEYLSSGITSCFDMYPFLCADSYISMGFRAVFCTSYYAYWHDLGVMEEVYNRYNSYHPLISLKMGIHAEYTNTREDLENVSALVHKYKAPLWTHISETEKEVKDCKDRYGKTPAALFEELGLWDFGGGGYHCVHFTEEDMDIFARRGLTAVTCPGSNLKCASGIADLKRLKEKGVKLAVGTDGPASNNALDMFREMYLAAVLQKIKYNDAAAFSAKDILKAAITGGADAMELRSGRIAEGFLADLVMIDLSRPSMQPINDVVTNLVYAGSKDVVKMTMVGGKILYENGMFNINEDIDLIYYKANSLRFS